MRIALVVHGLPPYERTGVETHTEALARALTVAGAEVEVFAPRVMTGLAPFAQRREERAAGDASWAVTWCNAGAAVLATPEGQRGMGAAFGAFLDREAPRLVHFQHLVRLGLEAVTEAKQRGLPTIFVAHDFWPVHDAYTLTLPDLSTFELGDLGAEARGMLGLELLNGLDEEARGCIGDHHGTVLRDQLTESDWARLRALLHGETTSPKLTERVEDLAALRARKRAALTAMDLRFATSKVLARRLSAALGRAFNFRAAGIERGRFEGLEPTPKGRRLRIGFVGAVLKHKGLHVLLDAYEGLAAVVELHVHGSSGDHDYVARMKRRAAELGAVWHGGFTPEQLPARLAGLDVVAVPSLWLENAPFVLREAYAAGLPVLVSDTEALRESVTAGSTLTGLVVPSGDVDEWRVAMRRIAEESALRASLEGAVRSLTGPLAKRIEQEAGEWIATYTTLIGSYESRRPAPRMPQHVVPFGARVEALEGLSTRELFARVMGGIGRLSQAVGLPVDPETIMALAVGRGSRIRDELAADDRAIDWLRQSVAHHEEARTELEARSRWREEQIGELARRVAWFEGRVRARDEEVVALRAEREHVGEAQRHLTGERDWLRDSIAAKEAEQRELHAQVEEARAALRALTDERDWLRETLEAGNSELDWLRDHVSGAAEDTTLTDREALERHFGGLRDELDALRNHEGWLEGEVGSVLGLLATESEAAGIADGGSDAPRDPEAVARALARGRRSLARMVAELTWRREEMNAARQTAQSLFTRVAGGSLARRARSWSEDAHAVGVLAASGHTSRALPSDVDAPSSGVEAPDAPQPAAGPEDDALEARAVSLAQPVGHEVEDES